jgi:outer membrane protein TolC
MRTSAALRLLVAAAATICLIGGGSLRAQDSKPRQVIEVEGHCVYPINLATALQLAQVRSLDIRVAAERVAAADAQLGQAQSKWLPTVVFGGDYARQDGRIQDIVGNVLTTSRDSLMVGVGPAAVFSPSEAIFAPLAARQVVTARGQDFRAAENDTLFNVADAYFALQQARGELAGELEAERLATEVVRRAEGLSTALAEPVEVHRSKTELSRRKQAVEAAHERAEIALADLNRLLRLPPTTLLEPVETPQVRVELFDGQVPVDELIPVGLTNRPELASQQALVAATLARLRQEKLRPLVPSVLLRGNATNPAGTLSTGRFAGGVDGNLSNAGWRNSYDVQVLWELQGLGFGNRAAIREREADNRAALLELFRVQDRVAAEVVQAHAQVRRASARATLADEGLKEATETVKKSLEGFDQTRRIGERLVLVFRPQEVVAAVQALDQAYRDHFAAVADANRAQFRLYRALGQPAESVLARVASPQLPCTPAQLPPPAAKIEPATQTIPAEPGSTFATDRRR